MAPVRTSVATEFNSGEPKYDTINSSSRGNTICKILYCVTPTVSQGSDPIEARSRYGQSTFCIEHCTRSPCRNSRMKKRIKPPYSGRSRKSRRKDCTEPQEDSRIGGVGKDHLRLLVRPVRLPRQERQAIQILRRQDDLEWSIEA